MENGTHPKEYLNQKLSMANKTHNNMKRALSILIIAFFVAIFVTNAQTDASKRKPKQAPAKTSSIVGGKNGIQKSRTLSTKRTPTKKKGGGSKTKKYYIYINGKEVEETQIGYSGGEKMYNYSMNVDGAHYSFYYIDEDENFVEYEPSWCRFGDVYGDVFSLIFEPNPSVKERTTILGLYSDDATNASALLLIEQAANPNPKVPFSATSCSVSNEDNNGTTITDFGNTIYSYNTKYLKPRLTLESKQSGNFTIYYKLFKPDGTLSTGTNSPSGYSVSSSIYIYQGTHTYKLDGWGSNTSGHWKAGDYRYEFYCNGESLGYYEFTIK